MSEDEKRTKKPDRILEIVEKVLGVNEKTWKQLVLELKILSPNQTLSRLPISLTQLKAGINSEKIKNENR